MESKSKQLGGLWKVMKMFRSYLPRASMGGLPRMGRSPGVLLVPGVGASLRGVGVLDLRPGVEDLSFCEHVCEREEDRKQKFSEKWGSIQAEDLSAGWT